MQLVDKSENDFVDQLLTQKFAGAANVVGKKLETTALFYSKQVVVSTEIEKTVKVMFFIVFFNSNVIVQFLNLLNSKNEFVSALPFEYVRSRFLTLSLRDEFLFERGDDEKAFSKA